MKTDLTEEEIRASIQKHFNSSFKIIETENYLKVVSTTGSWTTGKAGKEQFKKMLKEEFEKENPFI